MSYFEQRYSEELAQKKLNTLAEQVITYEGNDAVELHNFLVLMERHDRHNENLLVAEGDAAKCAAFGDAKRTMAERLYYFDRDHHIFPQSDNFTPGLGRDRNAKQLYNILNNKDYDFATRGLRSHVQSEMGVHIYKGSALDTLSANDTMGLLLSDRVIDTINYKLGDLLEDYEKKPARDKEFVLSQIYGLRQSEDFGDKHFTEENRLAIPQDYWTYEFDENYKALALEKEMASEMSFDRETPKDKAVTKARLRYHSYLKDLVEDFEADDYEVSL